MRLRGIWAGWAFAGLMVVCVLTGAQASPPAPSVSEVAPGVYSVKNLPISEGGNESSVAAGKVAQFKASRSAGWSSQELEASATDHADLGAAGAESLFLDEFGAQVGDLLEDPAATLRSAEEIIGFRDDFTAVVDPVGPEDRALVVSTAPIRTDDGALPDLGLESSGSSISVKEPTTEVEFSKDPREGIEIPQTDVGISFDDVRASAPDGSIVAVDGAGSGEAAFYPNALTDADLIAAPLANGVETLAQLRSEDSPEEITMPVDTPDGGSVSASEDGGAVIMGANGDPVAQVYPPTAVDAKGDAVPMTMSVDGANLVLNVAHRDLGFAYPILIDPVVETWNWWTGTHTTYPGWQFLKIGDDDYQGSTYCFQVTIDSCGAPSSGGGLFAYAGPNKQYTQSSQARWMFVPPGSDSYIGGATVTSWRYKKGGASNGNPFAYWGIASGFLWNDYQITDLDSGGNNRTIQGGTEAQQFAMGLTTNSTMTLPAGTANWRYNRIGAIQLSLGDKNPPTLNPISTTGLNIPASGWINQAQINSNRSIHASAWDSGLGVKKIVVLGAAAAGGWYSEAWDSGCTGGFQGLCSGTTPSGGVDILVRPALLNQGVQTLTALAIDAKDTNSTAQTFQIRIDKDAPMITKSGPLTTASQPGDEITIKVDDNALSNATFDSAGNLAPTPPTSENPNLRSGAKDFKLYVDGQQVDSRSRTCDPVYGSCRLGPVTFTPDLSSYADGSHGFKVVATDQAGNSTTSSTWQRVIDQVPAEISFADAPTGWQTGPAVPVSVQASNGSAGIAKILIKKNGIPVKTETVSCSPGCPSTFDGTVQVDRSSLDEGDNTLMVYAVGPTGTESEPKVVQTKVDGTAASVTIDAPAWVGTIKTIGVTASNVGSGIATVKVKTSTGDVIGQLDIDCSDGCPASVDQDVQFDASNVAEGASKSFEIEVFDGIGREVSNSRSIGVERTAPSLSSIGGTLPSLAGQQVDSNADETVIAGGTDTAGSVNSGMATISVADLSGGWSSSVDCTVSSCASPTIQVPLSSLSDSDMHMQVVATDKAGNEDREEIQFVLDRNAPIVDVGTDADQKNGVRDFGPDLDFWLSIFDSPDDSFTLGTKVVSLDGDPITPEPCDTACGTRTYRVANLDSGSHELEVTATDQLGHTTELEHEFLLDKDQPEINIDGDLTPDADIGAGAQDLELTAEDPGSGDDQSGIASATVQIDGVTKRSVTTDCETDDCDLSEIFKFAEDELATGVHEIKLVVSDTAGNQTDETYSITRECDASNPVAVSTSGSISDSAAIDNVETFHPDVVAPSTETEVDDTTYQPTLVETPNSLDSEQTREQSELPREPDGAVVVGEGAQSVCLVAGTLAEDADGAVVVNDDSAIYPNTEQDTDTVVRPTVDGVESYEILRSEDSPELFHWDLASSNDQSLSQNPDGSISVEMSGANLPVSETPEDIPAMRGEASGLVQEGKLPPNTVDAMEEPDVEVQGDIDETLDSAPLAGEVSGAITGPPTGVSTPPDESGLQPTDMPDLLDELANSAEEARTDLAADSFDTYQQVEASQMESSQADAEDLVDADLANIAAQDVEIARIHEPVAIDANHDEVPVEIGVDEDQIDMEVNHSGGDTPYEYPIAVDPEVEAETTEIDWEEYPVYVQEQYVSGSTIALRQIGWWNKKYCKWINCAPESAANWIKVAGKYTAYVPGSAMGPLFEAYKKPVFSTRTVFSRWEYRPVVRKTKLTYTDPGLFLRDENYDRGMNIVSFGRNSYTFGKNHDRFKSIHGRIGSATAILVPNFKVYGNADIYASGDTSTDADIANGIRESRASGMNKVILKPHVDPNWGAWRGDFNFKPRNQFWPDYQHLLVGLCNIEEQQNVQIDGLVISTELSKVDSDQPEKWKNLIQVLRNQCQGVKLYISLNWDRVLNVNALPGWLSKLNYVGIDYYPDNSNVAPERMWLAAKQIWKRFGGNLNGVLFTEVGARHWHNNNMKQQDYYRKIAKGMMAGRHYNWFKGFWWYDKHVADDGDPKIAPDADAWTTTTATMRFLCRTQTMLTNSRCEAINPGK